MEEHFEGLVNVDYRKEAEYRSAITNPATLGPGGCRIIHFSGLLID